MLPFESITFPRMNQCPHPQNTKSTNDRIKLLGAWQPLVQAKHCFTVSSDERPTDAANGRRSLAGRIRCKNEGRRASESQLAAPRWAASSINNFTNIFFFYRTAGVLLCGCARDPRFILGDLPLVPLQPPPSSSESLLCLKKDQSSMIEKDNQWTKKILDCRLKLIQNSLCDLYSKLYFTENKISILTKK